jgi:hypothetical protein
MPEQPGKDSDASSADQHANASFKPVPLGSTTQSCPFQGNEHQVICTCICACKSASKPQWCVSKKLWDLDESSGFTSTIKAEVPYDMSTSPPAPYYPSNNNPARATKRRPKDSRIPDAVIVKNGSMAPTQDNIAELIEIKFPPDDWKPGQLRAYKKIAGDAPVTELGPKQCGCSDPEEPVPVPVPVPAPKKKEEEQTTGISGKDVAVVLAGIAIIAGLLLAPEITVPALAAAF